MILDYVLVPLLSAVYVSITAARLLPQIPYAIWAFLFASGITAVNVRGIEMTAIAIRIITAVMVLATILFLGAGARYVVGSTGLAALWVPAAVFEPRTFAIQPLLLGAGIATLSYLGFDAVSTLAEDVRNPETDIAYATSVVCLLQTLFCFLIVYLAAVVWSPARPFPNVETEILDVSRLTGGRFLFAVTTFVLLVAGVASSITSQAGASRLLYGMGRDGMLPRSIFAYLHPKYATPTRSILLMGIVSFAGALAISFQLVVELVNFGAFFGFVLVNLSVIRHYYARGRLRSGIAFWTNLVMPALGAVICAGVWLNLSRNAMVAGFAWLGAGVIYLAALTRGFRRPPAQLELP